LSKSIQTGIIFYLATSTLKCVFSAMRLPAIFIGLLLTFSGQILAQEKDTTRFEKAIEHFKDSKVTKRVTESITQTPPPDNETPQKSEEHFLPYEGKIIRKILINPVSFERNVTDTTRKIANTIQRVGNSLHSNSKHWMLRDLLFFYENKPLDPFKLADNERFLRDQDFVKDARIYVTRTIQWTLKSLPVMYLVLEEVLIQEVQPEHDSGSTTQTSPGGDNVCNSQD
jgi:hypothetical protein